MKAAGDFPLTVTRPTPTEALLFPPSQGSREAAGGGQVLVARGKLLLRLPASGLNSALLENESESQVCSFTSATRISQAWSWVKQPLWDCCGLRAGAALPLWGQGAQPGPWCPACGARPVEAVGQGAERSAPPPPFSAIWLQ